MGRTYSIHKELRGRAMVEWLIVFGLVAILALLLYMDRDDY
jgi:Tfp pilus assembly protein PilE